MPSPFPGMNPYLERAAIWNDFHFRYLGALANDLTAAVAPGYFVKVGEHLYIRDAWAEEESLAGHSDLSVSLSPQPVPSGGSTSTALAHATSPTTIELMEAFEPERSQYLEVVDRDRDEVVTVVELLSPANKRAGPDREAYLAKRREVLASPVHLIEIDLLRGWKRMPGRNLPASEYCVLVSRYQDRPRASYWGIGLREPLPAIPIPLREGEPEPTLDILAPLHRVYDLARYGERVYRWKPEPRLSPENAAWATELLTTAGVTPAI